MTALQGCEAVTRSLYSLSIDWSSELKAAHLRCAILCRNQQLDRTYDDEIAVALDSVVPRYVLDVPRTARGISAVFAVLRYTAEGNTLLLKLRVVSFCSSRREHSKSVIKTEKQNFAKVPKCSCSKVQEHGLGYTEIHAKLSPKAHCKSGLVLHIRHY